jgi:predicted enzyme related to lactoylglutathione lyase
VASDIQGIVGILLYTHDLERMRTFYRDVVGFEPLHDRPHQIIFRWEGNFRLTIVPHSDLREGNRDPLHIMLNLGVSDIGAVHRRLSAAGVTFIRPPEQEPWGGWIATFQDPDNNIIQLLQNASEPAP